MTDSILEVIAITPDDAIAAERGGASRLEVVRAIDVGGLTPSVEQFTRIREAVDIPLRVMLRTNAGFQVSRKELDQILGDIAELRRAGADAFVLGFLDDDQRLDIGSIETVVSAISPCRWTLHHAFDFARDAGRAWRSALDLPGLDCVLTGGVEGDLSRGLQTLCQRGEWQSTDVRWLAGGGLVLDYVEPLLASGIRAFHIGRSARFDRSWDQPVSEDAVRVWRERIDIDG